MTRSVLGRLVWKEYRLLRGFWAAEAVAEAAKASGEVGKRTAVRLSPWRAQLRRAQLRRTMTDQIGTNT